MNKSVNVALGKCEVVISVKLVTLVVVDKQHGGQTGDKSAAIMAVMAPDRGEGPEAVSVNYSITLESSNIS